MPARRATWSAETWTALGFGILCAVMVTAAAHLWRVRRWSSASLWGTKAVAVSAAIGGAWLVRPTLFSYLLFQFQRVMGRTGYVGVSELSPLLAASPEHPIGVLNGQFGSSWILAFPALAALVYVAWKTKRPGLTLFVVWSAVMTAAAFAQVRMMVYVAVNLAILAAWTSAWLVRRSSRLAVRIPVAALVLLCLAANLAVAMQTLSMVRTPSLEWRRSLDWLRTHSPEPLGDPAAWTNWYPSPPGHGFPYPQQAYSVAVWWDFGYWV
jgi:asparagine N-glycosylation enzyme membrane subunit Stt3